VLGTLTSAAVLQSSKNQKSTFDATTLHEMAEIFKNNEMKEEYFEKYLEDNEGDEGNEGEHNERDGKDIVFGEGRRVEHDDEIVVVEEIEVNEGDEDNERERDGVNIVFGEGTRCGHRRNCGQ
jgi:hypothetical protein